MFLVARHMHCGVWTPSCRHTSMAAVHPATLSATAEPGEVEWSRPLVPAYTCPMSMMPASRTLQYPASHLSIYQEFYRYLQYIYYALCNLLFYLQKFIPVPMLPRYLQKHYAGRFPSHLAAVSYGYFVTSQSQFPANSFPSCHWRNLLHSLITTHLALLMLLYLLLFLKNSCFILFAACLLFALSNITSLLPTLQY